MTFWELLALMGAMATILGVWLAVYAIINNKTLKEESRLTREVLEKESSETKKILDKIDSHIAGLAEFTKRGFRDIIADNEKTRSFIKTTQ